LILTPTWRVTRNKADLDVDGKRHDEHGDHDVGDGQRHDEVVGGRAQRRLAADAQHDQRVAEQRQRRDHDQHQRPVAQRRRRPRDLQVRRDVVVVNRRRHHFRR